MLSVRGDGAPLPHYDMVIPRIGAAMTPHGCAVVEQLEAMGIPCLAGAEAIRSSRDKRRAHQMMASAGIHAPRTSFFCVPSGVQEVLASAGPLPLVFKPTQSSQGLGVELARTAQDLERLIDHYVREQKDFLVQTFVDEAAGEDLRCIVLGDRVVAAMTRTAAPGEFRSNLHQGGRAKAATLSDSERALALHAASVFGLAFAGVDILRTRSEPIVLEVNSSPGLEGIERATGLDIASEVIAHIEHARAISAYPETAA